ncbi:MAG: putative glycoside hydrolase [Velocimicrobium sp.]
MKYKKSVKLIVVSMVLFILCTSCQNADGRVDQKGESKNTTTNIEATKSPEVTKTPEPTPIETLSPKEARKPVSVHGIYVTGPKAGSSSMDELISLVEDTKLNAMVIDVKNDAGEITYKMDLESVKEIGAAKNYITDMPNLIKTLKSKGIYLIARVVAFKDPILAEERPELALKGKDGSIFRDKSGLAWVNPYETKVWDYLLEVSKQAASLGFDEIQYDYIRFSTDSHMKQVDFGEAAKSKSKEDVITEFTKYMYENLSNLGVYVSADVYGIVINSPIDQKIVGQNYKNMAENLDYICPMIYPSHYADGSFGVEHPDLDPYAIVNKALNDSVLVLSDTKAATVRPWLQDFTATWLSSHQTYGKEQVESQIQAVEDAGYDEWILWNGSNRYTKLD